MHLEELSDSNILYHKRLPVFGFFVIGLTFVVLTSAIIWASLTTKPQVIQGSGTAQSANRTLVMSDVSGTVLAVNALNGSSVKEHDTIIQVKSVDRAIEQQTITAQISALQRSLDLEDRYGDALNKRSNLFSRSIADESHHYFKYEAARLQREQLTVDPASMIANGYTDVEIQNARKSNLLKLNENEASAKSTSAQLSAELRSQIEQLNIRANAAKSGHEASSVSAAVSGTLYLNANVKPGTVIAAGEPIGTIAAKDSGMSVKLYVAAPDRQFLKPGDRLEAAIAGLPDVIYGKLAGTIVAIDNDVTSVSAANPGATTVRTDSVFGIDVQLDRYFVHGRNGARHYLGNGTAIEAEFVYGGETYLEHIRGLLGL